VVGVTGRLSGSIARASLAAGHPTFALVRPHHFARPDSPGAAYPVGPYAHAPAAALYPPPPPPPAPPTSQQGAAAAQQLQLFWVRAEQYREIEATTDFKPAPRPDQEADEDVRMIAAEAPVVFARACEMFHLARGKGSQDRNRAMASASAQGKPTRAAEKIGKRNNLASENTKLLEQVFFTSFAKFLG